MSARPGGRAPRTARPSSSARGVALAAIRRVLEQGAYSNLVIPSALDRSGLGPRDRAFVSELAYGTLRRLTSLDWALARVIDRELARVDPPALAAARLGAYQLLFTRVPRHAAVAETVAVARSRERGFVNAVLRRLADSPPPWPEGDDDVAVSVRTGLAPWAVDELRRLVGERAEEAAAALGSPAPLSVRVNRCRVETETFVEALADHDLEARRSPLAQESLVVEAGGDPRRLPGFVEGWFAVQDPASTFVVRSGLDPQPGDRVLDVCSGPGGKAGHAACATEPGGLLVAADVAPGRALLVARTAARLGVRVAVVVQDGRRPALAGGFDRVLVDAPCSGLGSARRRPELLWRPRQDDVGELASLQASILAASADLVRPGGRLVYSVCTFPAAETDEVCDAVGRVRPDLEPVPIDGPDGPALRVRLWPHLHGADAMFVAGFRRR